MPAVDAAAIARSSVRVLGAARWFWWIAGLSVINSVVEHTGGSFNFVVGLAGTQIVDAVFAPWLIVAVLCDALAVTFFFFAGYFAQRGRLWAFALGGLVYAGDGAVFAWFGEWLPVAFHAYALFFIFNGGRELRELLRRARTASTVAVSPAGV